jgi:hypothetical protein
VRASVNQILLMKYITIIGEIESFNPNSRPQFLWSSVDNSIDLTDSTIVATSRFNIDLMVHNILIQFISTSPSLVFREGALKNSEYLLRVDVQMPDVLGRRTLLGYSIIQLSMGDPPMPGTLNVYSCNSTSCFPAGSNVLISLPEKLYLY